MTTILASSVNETYKGLLIRWDYRFNTLTMLFRLSLFFVFISLIVGRGELNQDTIAGTLLGYIVWFYAAIAISGMNYALVEEAQWGTLEQMFMSPAPSAVIVLARSFSLLIIATVMLTTIVGGLVVALRVDIPLRWEALPVFGLTMVSLIGLGFMMAGATLLFKQVDQLASLSENLLLYLSGAILPVVLLPDALGRFAGFLPTTHGIVLLRQVTLDGVSLGQAWADGGMVWLIVNALAYLVVGWAIFTACEKIAKRRGSLGQY
ncbi:MAG: ABC transporter permease [SAR202 cluster bacterium]|jgi:ABC-2 type transport system permease protein|nr:ABC transporter permease [SAR202 cluster bacterium]